MQTSITRPRTWLLLLFSLAFVLIVIYSYAEYRSRFRDVLTLYQDQAALTTAVIAQSSVNQVLLNEELQNSYAERAMDVLSLLSRLEQEENLSLDKLESVIAGEGIFQVTIVDSRGQAIAQANALKSSHAESAAWYAPAVQEKVLDFLHGSESWMVEDYYPERAGLDSTDSRSLLIGLARQRGGAYLARLNPREQDLYEYLTTLELGLEDLIRVQGMQYLILDLNNADPFAVSKGELPTDSTWIRSNLEDILYQVSKGDTTWLEIVRPVFFRDGIGEIRLGFDAVPLFKLRNQIVTQIILRTLLLVSLAFVTFWYVISRQNTALLEKEKHRIEGEVVRLEKLNRLREKQAAMGELAAGVAHEIRNPLNAIGIAAQRLKREFIPPSDKADYMALTSSMVTEIGRINQSLQEFLDFTKPTSLNLSQIDAASFLKELMHLYDSQAAEKNIGLHLSVDDIRFEADPVSLRNAVSNLINNALDACGPQDTIHIRCNARKNQVKIVVEDTGAGISEEQLPRLFDLYFSTKDMGTGVGLALTHKIISDHQGVIEVSSILGQGSTFEISLPVKQ